MSLVERFFPDAVIHSSWPNSWGVAVEINNYRKARPGYTPPRRPLVEWKKDAGKKSPWGNKIRDGHPHLLLRVGIVKVSLFWRAADDVCVDESSGYHIDCDHENGTRAHMAKRGAR